MTHLHFLTLISGKKSVLEKYIYCSDIEFQKVYLLRLHKDNPRRGKGYFRVTQH